jgi:phosphoribosylformylglycinamidine synthase
MGARPIAVMDPLRFGPLEDARSRWIFEGVVAGISGYGNSVGVPTVGGEVVFDDTYQDNPLVNVLCLGVMPKERLVLGQATGDGNLAVLLGSTTGRDGIGGVSVLASAGFGDEAADAAKRPNVQVGDPFEEKRLIEACLALLDAGLVVGIQDLGGAGLSCATSETAARGGMGMDVWVSEVPQRERGMAPFEVMTSESQERMLAIVAPSDLDDVLSLCRRWEVRASVIGRVRAGGALRIFDHEGGELLADVPAASLSDDAPLYDRPIARPAWQDELLSRDPSSLPAPQDCGDDLLRLVADASWVWSQYDHQLFLNTVEGPGGDAAVLKLKAPGLPASSKGLALSTDGNGRWCLLDPRRGTAMVVAESALNVVCAGARPVAVVNCLNFGNPEHPEVMWQLSEAIDGMREACEALGLPVVGGNVSLYNESGGRDIDPTPVIGTLGLIDSLDRRPPGAALVDGCRVLVLGDPAAESLAGSRWAQALHDVEGGVLPELDLALHAKLLELVRGLVADGLISGIHDVSEGGIAVTLAEMAVRGGVGCTVDGEPFASHRRVFSEAPSRVVVCAAGHDVDAVARRATAAGIAVADTGAAGGDRLVLGRLIDVAVERVTTAWRDAIPLAVAGDL